MKIIYLGQEIDNSVEQEIISDEEIGFNVSYNFKEGTRPYKSVTVYNVSGFYYLGEQLENGFSLHSQIHDNEINSNIKDIDIIKIDISDRVYTEFKRYE